LSKNAKKKAKKNENKEQSVNAQQLSSADPTVPVSKSAKAAGKSTTPKASSKLHTKPHTHADGRTHHGHDGSEELDSEDCCCDHHDDEQDVCMFDEDMDVDSDAGGQNGEPHLHNGKPCTGHHHHAAGPEHDHEHHRTNDTVSMCVSRFGIIN